MSTDAIAILEAVGVGTGVLFVVCMVCRAFIGIKSSEGAEGGVSHGLCDDCMSDWMES